MRGGRLVSNGTLVAICAYLVWSVLVILDDRWVVLGTGTVLALIALSGPTVASLPGLAFAIYLVEPWLIAAFTIMFLIHLYPQVMPIWIVRRRTPPEVLLAALEAVEPATLAALTSHAPAQPISTVTLVHAAAAQHPALWRDHLAELTGARWDGYLLRPGHGHTWTSVAAEAVVLAGLLARESKETRQLQLLAAAATLVAESAASALLPRLKPPLAVRATGLALQHLGELAAEFGTGPAGGDAVRRAALRMQLDPDRTVPNEVLFATSDRRLLLATLGGGMAGPVAVVAFVATLPFQGLRWLWRLLTGRRPDRRPRPATTTRPEVGVQTVYPDWTASSPQGWTGPQRPPNQGWTGPSRSQGPGRPHSSAPVRSTAGPSVASAAPVAGPTVPPAASRPGVPGQRQPRVVRPPRASGPPPGGLFARMGAWWQMTAARTSWPSTMALRLVRPACAVAVAVLAVLSALPWWAGVPIAVTVLIVKPLRRWWLELLLAAGLAAASLSGGPLLLSAAAIVLARLLVTRLALIGTDLDRAVVGPRRLLPEALTGEDDARLTTPKETRARYLAILADDDSFAGDSLEYVASAWAAADGPVLALALVEAVRCELFGWMPQALPRPLLMRRMRRLVVVESVVSRVPQYTLAALAAVSAVITLPGGDLTPGPVRLPVAWLCAAGAAAVVLLTTRPKPRYVPASVVVIAVLLAQGLRFLPTLAVVITGAVGAWALRQFVTRRTVTAAAHLSWVGRWVTGLRFRNQYLAASTLASRGRPGVAVDLLDEIVTDCPKWRPALLTVALAQRSLIELDRGNLQLAVEHSESARRHSERSISRTAKAVSSYSHGVVQFSVGAYAEAVTSLRSAERRLRRTGEGGTCLSVLARAEAAIGAVDEAMETAARAAMPLASPGQLLALVESQLAAGWALFDSAARADGTAESKAIVEEILSGFAEPFEAGIRVDDRTRHVWFRQLGLGQLLLGRIRLREGDAAGAMRALEDAVQQLRRTVAPDLLGMARIYQGQCHRMQGAWAAARTAVGDGIGLLEQRRGQLRSGDSRADAVNSGMAHYDAALAILADAQHHGDPEAGLLAAGLMESLRRNALATTLRDERASFVDRLPAEARAVIAQIDRLELGVTTAIHAATDQPADPRAAEQLQHLRKQLAAAVSGGFAAAYLPVNVDYGSLLGAVGPAHVLQFEFTRTEPGRWDGHRAWSPPNGTPWVDAITVTDAGALEILRAIHDRDGAGDAVFSVTLLQVSDAWTALAAALLPAGLIAELCARDPGDPARLLVVPGEHLAYLPWGALLLDQDDAESVLVHKAITQLVPSLNLLRSEEIPAAGSEVLAYLDEDAKLVTQDPAAGATFWQRLTTTLPMVPVSSRHEFEQGLVRRRPAGVFLTAHGTGTGLSQGIHFSDGGMLSAATAFRLPWPRWMVFASCFVAKVEQRAGREPLGLVVACMLGGCRSIVGGVIAVEGVAAGEIGADVAIAMSKATDPAAALRDAQRAFLREWGAAAFINHWAGLICISTEWTKRWAAPRGRGS
ncbi:CHAT domain-containing protein [Dactylosporangium sp. NPDC049742]|uniref:CHAT domain-containing protein n=1 Tax=Dactylosporangium sp. NPDC049742 TaxID=3154737 RepID=UPI00343AA774